MGITNSNKEISVGRIDCGGEFKVTLSVPATPDIVSSPADIVLVEDIQPDYLAVFLGCGGEALRREEFLRSLLRQEFLLRERLPRLDYLIPDVH